MHSRISAGVARYFLTWSKAAMVWIAQKPVVASITTSITLSINY